MTAAVTQVRNGLAWWGPGQVPGGWCDSLLVLPPQGGLFPASMRLDGPSSIEERYRLPRFSELPRHTVHALYERLAREAPEYEHDWRVVLLRIPGGFEFGGEAVHGVEVGSQVLVIEQVATRSRVAVLVPGRGSQASTTASVQDFAEVLWRAAQTMQPTTVSASGRFAATLHGAVSDPTTWFRDDLGRHAAPSRWSSLGLSAEEALFTAASGFASSRVLDLFLDHCAQAHTDAVRPAAQASLPTRSTREGRGRRLRGVVSRECFASWQNWAAEAYDPPMTPAEIVTWASATATWDTGKTSIFDVTDRHWLRDRAREGWTPDGCLALVAWFAERETDWTPRQPISEINTRLLHDLVGPAEMARHAMRWTALVGPRQAAAWLWAGHSVDEAYTLIEQGDAPTQDLLAAAAALRRV